MIWTDLQNMSELFLRNFWYLNQIYKRDSNIETDKTGENTITLEKLGQDCYNK